MTTWRRDLHEARTEAGDESPIVAVARVRPGRRVLRRIRDIRRPADPHLDRGTGLLSGDLRRSREPPVGAAQPAGRRAVTCRGRVMTDLVEFLTARLDEREQIARAAVWEDDDPDWNGVDTWDFHVARGTMEVGPDKGAPTEAASVIGPFKGGLQMRGDHLTNRSSVVAEHIAANDPAYVLADVDAKRAIVELHPEMLDWCQGCAHETYPCRTLRLLAQPYADHPDYDESWRR